MAKVIITTDSIADLSPELYEKYDIKVIPLYVNMDEKSLADNGVEVTPDDIYKFVDETGKLPTTSACPIGNYQEVFKKYLDEGFEIVHLNISSNFSCTHQNALMAAEDLDGVYPVDTRNLSTGSGLLVLEAARMRDEGKSAEEIANELKGMVNKVDASFVIDDLTYLHKGGRCSAAAKFGANLLKLKPCIQVREGAMDATKKYRGEYKACVIQYVKDKLVDIDSVDTKRIFVTHTKCDDEVLKAAIDTVNECAKFDEMLVTTAGCTVTTHCGPNTLGVLFFRKSDI